MHGRGAIDPGLDEAGGSILAGEHGRQGAAQAGAGQRALPDHHDDLALGAPVLRQTPVPAVRLAVRGPDVAADVTAVDLDMPPGAAEVPALEFPGHRLAELVGQDEGGLVLDVEVARQRQRRLALDLVADDHDRRQIVADLQLVEGEQGARRRAEVAPAGRAAEPRRPVGPRAGPARRTAAMRAHRRPSVSGQRIEQNIVQASASSIRKTCFRLMVRAAAVSRKCWDMDDLRGDPRVYSDRTSRKHYVPDMF